MKFTGKKSVPPLLLFIIFSYFPLIVHADLIFTAPPREKIEEASAIYQPIAASLSNLLGERVIYQHPGNWISYSYNMRKGKYDIVFDGPQFAAWRIEHIGHSPLVRLKGNLKFYVISKKNNSYQSLDDLIGLRVCGLSSPNLATLTMMREFSNPVLQPYFIEVKGGMMKSFEKLQKDRCVAAVLRDNIFENRINEQLRSEYKILWKSEALPNQVITVSDKVSNEMQEKITSSLTTDSGAQSSKALFKRFSKTSTRYVKANKEEFTGLNKLMEGTVRGW